MTLSDEALGQTTSVWKDQEGRVAWVGGAEGAYKTTESRLKHRRMGWAGADETDVFILSMGRLGGQEGGPEAGVEEEEERQRREAKGRVVSGGGRCVT